MSTSNKLTSYVIVMATQLHLFILLASSQNLDHSPSLCHLIVTDSGGVFDLDQ